MKIYNNYSLFPTLKLQVPYAEAPEQAIKLEHAAIVVTKAEGETCERCWTVTLK